MSALSFSAFPALGHDVREMNGTRLQKVSGQNRSLPDRPSF
jgi:hypothetical protein